MAEQELDLLTELSAINMMLAGIGEAPVNSIDDTGLEDAVVARNTLRNVSRQVQNKGWHWNTVEKLRLLPSTVDPVGVITVPKGTLKAWSTDADVTRDIALRGTKLFDRDNGTNVFTTGVYVGYVQLLQFDELPSPARDYIGLMAVEQFQEDRLGSAQLSAFQQRRQRDAFNSLNLLEAEARRSNAFTGSYSLGSFMQNRR